MNEFNLVSTDELSYGLSRLVMERKKYLFRHLTEGEKKELQKLNREIKRYNRELGTRQLRMKGF